MNAYQDLRPRTNTGPPVRAELGELSLHLPTGSASITGFVRHHDGGAITGGGRFYPSPARSVGQGGSELIFEPTYPESNPLDDYGFNWAHRSPSDAQTVAEARGWRIVSRRIMADLLRQAEYRLCTDRAFGHVLYLDEADEKTWHVPELRYGGTVTRYLWSRHVFVVRENSLFGGLRHGVGS